MPKPGFSSICGSILAELTSVLSAAREEEVETFLDSLRQADAIFVTGEGRSGLVGRCFAMRLMHLGLRAHVVGETVAPALAQGDLLVAISGSGESEVTCGRAKLAAAKGARVAAVTADANSTLAAAADVNLLLPTGMGAASEQYGGSAFEQACFIALDAIALQLQRELGRTTEEMDAAHATVE